MSYREHKDNIGYFTEKDFGREFTYKLTKDEWAIEHGYTHEIDVNYGNICFAVVKKTVVYVCTSDNTSEKWYIKNHVMLNDPQYIKLKLKGIL